MARKRPAPKPGDLIEVELGCCIAYLLVLRDTALGIYANCYASRPPIAVITGAEIAEVVYVSGTKIEEGEWPVIGHSERMVGEEWWPPTVKYSLPSNPRRFMVVERGRIRPATEADEHLPLQVKLSEKDLFDRLRRHCRCSDRIKGILPQIQQTHFKPVETAMSIDRNDVAERVKLAFDEAMFNSKKADSALSATVQFFREDMMDDEFAIPFWLALADIAVTHDCLTHSVACQAKDVIDSGKHLLVVESWNPESERPEAERLRREAIAKLLSRMKAATFN